MTYIFAELYLNINKNNEHLINIKYIFLILKKILINVFNRVFNRLGQKLMSNRTGYDSFNNFPFNFITKQHSDLAQNFNRIFFNIIILN